MTAQDKVEHWAFGFVLTFFALVNPWLIFLGFAFGISKELYDATENRFDALDLAYTFLGASLAVVLLVNVDAFSWGMIF